MSVKYVIQHNIYIIEGIKVCSPLETTRVITAGISNKMANESMTHPVKLMFYPHEFIQNHPTSSK